MSDRQQRIVLPALFGPNTDFTSLAWKPFRSGIDIVVLYGDPSVGPCSALLRYQPGATVPLHRHDGYEHIFMLQGEQSDEDGSVGEGTLVIKPPGTSHAVRSNYGCIVLAIWEKTISFEPSADNTL